MPRVSQDSHFHLADLRGIFRAGPFRRYMIYNVILFAGFSLACSYYAPFFLKEIGLSFRQVGWYRVGHNVLMLLALLPGGRLVDRVGARPVVIIMTLIYMVFFALFPLFSAQRYWLILAAWSGVGIADGLFGVALTSTLYHALPTGPERTGYLAVSQGTVLVCMGLGPFLVRIYLALAKGVEFRVLGMHFERFRLMFFACAVLMLGAAVAALRLKNTRDVRSLICRDFEIQEICLFPDKVFSFSDAESAVILGRRVAAPAPWHCVSYRRVREADMDQFRLDYEVTSRQTIPQRRIGDSADHDMLLPDLCDVWDAMKGLPCLESMVDLGQGFQFQGVFP